MGKALLIVDYQNEWIDEESEYYVGDISEQIKAANKLIAFCRENDIPIIFTTHIEPESEKEFKKGTKAVEIIKDIDFDKEKDTIIEKNAISPFYDTELEDKLEELDADELIIAGILTNLCVRSAVSDAYDRGLEIKLISDACAAMSEDVQEFTLMDLEETRPEIEIMTADEFIENA